MVRLRPWMPRVLAPAVLLTLCGVVQGVYLRPVSVQDGMTYFENAAAFPNVSADHWSLRIGLVLPLRGLQLVFGYSEAAYYAIPLLAGALLVIATYGIGWKLFNPVVGFAAALLLVLNSMFVNATTILLPDLFGSALVATAFLILLHVAERSVFGRHEHRMLVLCGLLLGWGYLVREFVVFLFPVVLVIFLCYRVPWRELRWIAGAAVAMFLGEVVLNSILYGSPLARLLVSGGHGGQRAYITDSRLDALVRLPHALGETPGAFPVLLLLVLLGCSLAIRSRSFRIVTAWFLAFWLPMTLGTGLIEPSFRFVIADKLRYWMPLLPAVAIGGVAVAHHVISAACRWVRLSKRVQVWLPATALLVLAPIVGLIGSAEDRALDIYRVNGANQLVTLRTWLERHGSHVSVIWTDSFTARAIPVFAHSTFGRQIWDGRVLPFDVDGKFVDTSLMDRGAVVLYRPGYQILYRVPPVGHANVPFRHSPIRGYRRDPPPNWERVLTRPDTSLIVYRINPDSNR